MKVKYKLIKLNTSPLKIELMKSIIIVKLPKEKWKDQILPIGYTTNEYYEFTLNRHENGFNISLEKKPSSQPITHTPEENDFPDKLYQEYFPEAQAFGVLESEKLIAAIEICPEEWSNRMRITELWVSEEFQRKGIGHALMEKAKAIAREQKRRAIILETQTCNVNAIGFYLHEGFTLIGFDLCCYSNHDIEDKGVRIELGFFYPEFDKK